MEDRANIRCILEQGVRDLAASSDSPRLDAEILLSLALGKPRNHLHAWPREKVERQRHDTFRKLIQRRRQGEPIAYLTGQQEFWSLKLRVTPDTLVPRPETEHLVELALDLIPRNAAWHIADLGTGPGTIALALAHERPRCKFVAVDICEAALAVAMENARRLDIPNVSFRQSDWFSQIQGQRFDVITANPPYVRSNDPCLARLTHEPGIALVSGPGGMEALETIICEARLHLKDAGWLLLEHGHDQGEATLELLRRHGYHKVAGHRDYAGHARNAAGQYLNAAT